MQNSSTQIVLKPSPKPIITTPKIDTPVKKPTTTGEINSKETSPTLVEFQNKNAQLPDWRLQLKNAVQKRKSINNNETGIATDSATSTISIAPSAQSYPTSGGNALKAEVIEERQPESVNSKQLASALKRIERSRKKFYVAEHNEESLEFAETIEEEKPVKDYPFKIASRNDNPTIENKLELKTSVNFAPKPTLVPEPEIKKTLDLYDTSELDPKFVSAKIISSFEKHRTENKVHRKIEESEEKIIEISNKIKEETIIQTNVIDEVAPFALRFNSGLFDLIIGSFASLVLLAPFMLLGGNWFTVAGLFAFIATSAIVMFIYMTTTIGMLGKTFGMHLFGLELIDYFDDEYPTFHQAAVSSSIYLLSIAVGGLGFISYFFDEDKRAVHDLVSGTIVVREI